MLAAVTMAVYWPAIHCGFINYDDPQYVTLNRHVRQGLTPSGLRWALGTGLTANWHPVTWLSHMIDAEVFGLNPAGHHLVSVLFHAANAVLLFILLRALTGAQWRSAFVAALFALHPLHVESVAWIAERKDVLSTFFGLLSLVAYTGYAQGGGGGRRAAVGGRQSDVGCRRAEDGDQVRPPTSDLRSPTSDLRLPTYGLSLLFFALGLMSKPMLVTWPFVMLLLDYWPLGRGKRGEERDEKAESFGTTHHSPLTSLILEKLPFFIVSIVFCVVTFLVQKHSGAVLSLAKIPLGMRIENMFVSYARYLEKLLWPADLAVVYPYPAEWPLGWVIFSAILVVGLCVAGWWLGRRWPFIRTGWFWFFGTLIPVIGLVQVGNQSMADRYTYVPSIGVFILLVWGVCALFGLPDENRRGIVEAFPTGNGSARRVAIAGGIVILGACAARTWDQLSYWQDSETLFRHTVAVTRNNGLAYDNLGFSLFEKGRLEEAMACYHVALEIHPKDAIAQDGIGCCFFNGGRIDDAIAWFQRSLATGANPSTTLFNLGSALAQRQRYSEAIHYFTASLQSDPENSDAQDSLGNVLFRQNRYAEAMDCYRAAMRIAPDHANAHRDMGRALYQQGRFEEALQEYHIAERLAPNDADSHLAMGIVLARLGHNGEAVAQLQEVLKLRPGDSEAKRGIEALTAR
jgi:tetratricopeptide (TPR) repeat protein